MCFSKWSMHFFLKCMCFTRKGMCSSTMNNVPNGTTLYYLAGISTALHIHSFMTMSAAPQEDTHQSCHSQVLMHICSLGKHKWERGGMESFCRWLCLLNEQETRDFFSSPVLLQSRGGKNNRVNTVEVLLFLTGKLLPIYFD